MSLKKALRLEAFFHSQPRGEVFCVRYSPELDNAQARLVLVAPPLFEELNQCRSFVARLAERLALAGNVVLSPDYIGTGDSGGEFIDYNLQDWAASVHEFLKLIDENKAPISAVAVRGGALVLAEALRTSKFEIDELFLVEPVTNGRQHLSEFFRVRLARALFEGKPQSHEDLLDEMVRKGRVEVMGYPVSQELYRQICAANASTLGEVPTVHVLERNKPKIEPLETTFPFAVGRIERELFSVPAFWAMDIDVETDEIERSIARQFSAPGSVR
ncbi:MAG: hypothetical protein AAF384_18930 [Pseudomonadota bacterium]